MTDRARPATQPEWLSAITSLAEPNRRALYEHVARAGDWVSRDQAALAVGLERGTAAHHLDRLAADGLLEVDYQRRSGRSGPGAGRTAKLYRRSPQQLEVSMPPRDYELAGQLLAEAADRSRTEGTDITTALDEAARAEGHRMAEDVRRRLESSDRSHAADRRGAVLEVLDQYGFEPRAGDDGVVVLTNCPFHRLARQHRGLICGMNLCLLEAAIDNVGQTGLDARLEPEEGACCVKLRPA
jgi:predicted ArsR family transcriptional regulator